MRAISPTAPIQHTQYPPQHDWRGLLVRGLLQNCRLLGLLSNSRLSLSLCQARLLHLVLVALQVCRWLVLTGVGWYSGEAVCLAGPSGFFSASSAPLTACPAAAEVVEADGRLLRGSGDGLCRRRERLSRRRDPLRRRRDRLRVRLAEPFRGMLKKCSSRFSCVYVCRYYVHIYKYPYISIFLISCGPAAPPLEQDARGGSRELLQDPRHWAKTLQVRGQSSMSPPKLRKATHSRTCAWALQRGRATAAGIYTFLRLARTAELPRGAWQRHSYIGPLFSSPFPP